MVSAVILTHNDEAILPRCLKSVEWCDEIVVVDDRSIDGTVALAKKLGASVWSRPLRDDFAAQRNFGLAKAKGEWVFFVDSDEVVLGELAYEIQALPFDKNGYFVKRKDYWGGTWLKHGETGSAKLLRLARKNAGLWEQPVHETWHIDGPVGELVHPLLHYPHQNVAQFLEDVNRYSTLYAHYLHTRDIREPIWTIAVKPAAKFFVNYVLRFGFLDGTAGLVVALMMSVHSFLVRAKLWFLWRFS